MAHTGGGHPAGSLQLLSGDPDPQDKLTPVYPDVMTVAHYLRSGHPRALPNYVGVNPITRYDNFTIAGPAYLGPAYEPFAVLGDPSAPGFTVPNIGLTDRRSGRPAAAEGRAAALVRRAATRDRPLGHDRRRWTSSRPGRSRC